jgi:hypothetical protein
VSWTTSLLLAAVLWLDGGLRKVPSGSIVMRRSLLGPWRIVDIVREGAWHAVGRWPSLVMALVSTEPTKALLSARQLQARLQSVRVTMNILRAFGIVTSLVLVIGAPVAVGRFGRAGLYDAVACLLALGIITACVSGSAFRRLGADGWSSARFGAAFLWPFAGPYAAERVLALAVAGGSPVEVFRVLASAERFAHWARPHAYDALDRESSRKLRLLDGFDFHLGRHRVEALLSILPQNISQGSRFCPRCGANFQDDVRECTDCAGVELVTARSNLLPIGKPVARREALSRQGTTSLRRRRRRKR